MRRGSTVDKHTALLQVACVYCLLHRRAYTHARTRREREQGEQRKQRTRVWREMKNQ